MERKEGKAVARLKPPTPATRYVKLTEELSVIRNKCIEFIQSENTLMESLLGKPRDDIVLEWASDHLAWNEDRGGLTLAEIYLGTICHHSIAQNPNWYNVDLIRYKDVVSVFKQLKKAAVDPLSVDVDKLYKNVCVIMVVTLSQDLDTVIDHVSNELQQVPHPADVKDAEWKLSCESEAGQCVRGFIPMASRFFWYYWCEEFLTRGASDAKENEEDVKRFKQFDDWLNSQFKIQQQQSYRNALAELCYRDAIPMGGHLFSKRGDSTQELPSTTIVRTELPDDQLSALDKQAALPPSELNDAGHMIGKVHMFEYTYDNRLRTSAKTQPFDPYIVWKSDIPANTDKLLHSVMDRATKRPQRPVIIQTQTAWFLQHWECTCEHGSILIHVPSKMSCVLKRHILKMKSVVHALHRWCEIMEKDFDSQLPDGTSIKRCTDECLNTLTIL